MTEAKHSESWLPTTYGGGLRVVGDEGDRRLEIVASVSGQAVTVGVVPLARVILHLMPEAGFVVDRDWRGEMLSIDPTKGPVCVGGPYDGRRFLKSAGGLFREIRVPIRWPNEISIAIEPVEQSPAYSVVRYGTYKLEQLGKGKSPFRELWWWIPPLEDAA